MLPLPDRPVDRIRLADWLEIQALAAPDGDMSQGDLESALHTAALFRVSSEHEKIAELALDVFAELEARFKGAEDAYPFTIEGPVLQTREQWKEYPAYPFCLCLSYFGCRERKGAKAFPRRWFEHLSRDAAVQYLKGDGVRFGSPRLRSELPIRFGKAIDRVCECLKEGGSYKKGGLSSPKDDAVDIIVWKHFPDKTAGKLILFGNCASGHNWEGAKLTELVPSAFCSEWMTDPPRCEIIRSFFIPHRVEHRNFLSYLRKAGIIFDRCRIAHWCQFVGRVSEQIERRRFFDYSPLVKWTQELLSARVGQ